MQTQRSSRSIRDFANQAGIFVSEARYCASDTLLFVLPTKSCASMAHLLFFCTLNNNKNALAFATETIARAMLSKRCVSIYFAVAEVVRGLRWKYRPRLSATVFNPGTLALPALTAL